MSDMREDFGFNGVCLLGDVVHLHVSLLERALLVSAR